MRTVSLGFGRSLQYLAALTATLFSIEQSAVLRMNRYGTPRRARFKRSFYEPQAGRLTRKARRGYLVRCAPISSNSPYSFVRDPDRYLNSHARSMKALVEALTHRQPSALA